MTRLGPKSKAICDSTNEILNAWTLSETHADPRMEVKRFGSRRSSAVPLENNQRHIPHREVNRGKPHGLGRPASAPDTVLYEAFGAESLNEHPNHTEATAQVSAHPVSSQRTLDGILPKPGEAFGGFRIVLELGRGAFARVYLAEEMSLGSRLVAIKVSQAEGDEPQILARLQHTHIVPVHSVHTDPGSGLRILCMPYFGGANLAEVLECANAHSEPTVKRGGESLIRALDCVSRPYPGPMSDGSFQLVSRSSGNGSAALRPYPSGTLPKAAGSGTIRRGRSTPLRLASLLRRVVQGTDDHIQPVTHDTNLTPIAVFDDDAEQPARHFLRNASSVQAAVWIVARLAEGLEHAHSRGLLHRDIKPSNILIAADGTPMLLDFNLSVESSPSETTDLDRAMVGGTLPYMSPEHLDAFNPQGSTAPGDVDARSDIYALGLIFYEMIAGEPAFPSPPDHLSVLETIRFMAESRNEPPSLRASHPETPWSLDALAAKCLDPDPSRRYARAGDLAEDLRRFLDNLPMKHGPEPSPKERLQKWARRHPAISSSTSVGLLSLAFVLLLAGAIGLMYTRVEDLSSRLKLQVFQQRFVDAQFWLNTQIDRVEHLKKGLILSRQSLNQLGLRDTGSESSAGWIQRLPENEKAHVQEAAMELCLLDARAEVKLAERLGSEENRRVAIERAIRLLNRVEKFSLKPTPALFTERARYQEALGRADLALADRQKAATIPPSTAYDYLLLGTSRLAEGRAFEAESPLKESIKRDITSFWAWFSLGHCYFQQARYSDATTAFTAAVVRGPNLAWAHFNLGLALAKSGRLVDAQAAYDRAVLLDPGFAEALVNRGLVELELNELASAREDLERGIAAGRGDSGVLAALGETLGRLGRHADATKFFDRLLVRTPDNPIVFVARGMTRLEAEPALAKQDFEKALELEPNLAPALYGIARIVRVQDPAHALDLLGQALRYDPNLLDAVELRALIRARLADPATVDDVERLTQRATPNRLYNAACALAIFSDRSHDSRWLPRSLELLFRAIEAGVPATNAERDPDLAVLRTRPEFQSLIGMKPKG